MQTAHKDQIHHDVAGDDILASSDTRFNEYRRKWDENPKNLTHGDFPLQFQIELTKF